LRGGWLGCHYTLDVNRDGSGTNFDAISPTGAESYAWSCVLFDSRTALETKFDLSEGRRPVLHCYMPDIGRVSGTASACTARIDRGLEAPVKPGQAAA